MADRLVRLMIGFAVIALGIIYSSWWGLLGLIPVITAITEFCGFYVSFGISTCKLKKES